jgi:hypothetical protein
LSQSKHGQDKKISFVGENEASLSVVDGEILKFYKNNFSLTSSLRSIIENERKPN